MAPHLLWVLVVAVLGAAAGVAGWITWAALMPAIPIPFRFAVAFAVFVLGPGATIASLLARETDRIERWVIALGGGLVLSNALAQLLGVIGLTATYPAAAAALGGAGVATGFLGAGVPMPRRRDLAACALAAVLALGGGGAAYANRLSPTADGLVLNGEYDTFDSTFYAAISAELSHQIPPDALFRAGHRLGYAYHAQLLPAMIHRFGGVPLMDLYFGYVWPAYLVILALTIFMTVRRLASTGVALLSVALVLFGSDFSYVAAQLRPSRAKWDRFIWSNNWLTPGAEQLFFNTWTPALVVLFLGFWMVDRYQSDGRAKWMGAGAACFASLVQFKPFGFAAVMAGLLGAAVFGRADRPARRRYLLLFGASLAFALPYLYGVLGVYDESQAVLRLGSGYGRVLPERVVEHLGLEPTLLQMSRPFGGSHVAVTILSILVANVLFVAGGLGARFVALPGLWRTLKGADEGATWHLLAWTIVAGAAFPLVVVTEPDYQTFHTYHTSLFLLWVFAARAVVHWTRNSRWRRVLVVAALVTAAVPSTVHYLRVKWTDSAFGFIHRDLYPVADYLRQQDRERTVLLQRYPYGPSYLALLSERRTVLAWGRYSRGAAPLAKEIHYFFRSADGGNPAAGLRTLARYRVTHIVEAVGADHIHPVVLKRLQLLIDTETFRLYAVPSEIEGTAPDRAHDGPSHGGW